MISRERLEVITGKISQLGLSGMVKVEQENNGVYFIWGTATFQKIGLQSYRNGYIIHNAHEYLCVEDFRSALISAISMACKLSIEQKLINEKTSM